MKASPEEQLRLLELADLDAELGRIDHRRQGLPEHEELRTLQERDAQLRDSLAALEAEDIRAWFAAMPWRPGHSPVRWVPEYEDYLFEQWTHGTFDSFWRRLGIHAEGYYDQFADVPQIHMSSWYDVYVPTATGNYAALKARIEAIRLKVGPMMNLGDVAKKTVPKKTVATGAPDDADF